MLKAWKDRCPASPDGLAFPTADGSMHAREKPPAGFAELLEASRCPAIGFHGLRHTCASLMVMSGASLRAVQKLLGHSSITTTEKYSHLAPDYMEREADRLSLDLQPGLGQLVALPGGA